MPKDKKQAASHAETDERGSNVGHKISIGGNVTGSTLIVGNHNVVANTQNVFSPVYQALESSSLPAQEKEDLKAEIQEIETAVSQGEAIDETWLARRLRNLKRMAPDIAAVALSALAGPGAAVATIVKQVAEKVKKEA